MPYYQIYISNYVYPAISQGLFLLRNVQSLHLPAGSAASVM